MFSDRNGFILTDNTESVKNEEDKFKNVWKKQINTAYWLLGGMTSPISYLSVLFHSILSALV